MGLYKLLGFSIFLVSLASSLDLVLARAVPTSHLVRRDDMQQVMSAGPASACSLLDLDDVQSLPGWDKLQQYATDTWGEGDVTITINPPGYKDKPASLCVQPVNVTMTGDPNCTTSREGITPPKNSHTISVDMGYMNIGNWNITNVTSAAHAQFFLANFQMPNITSQNLDALKGKGAFINAPNNGFETIASNKTTHNTDVMAMNDKTCLGTVMNQQCMIPAEGTIELEATGYIWFTYEKKRAPVANPKGGQHKRYTVKIEDVLKNITERTVSIGFSGVMNTTMRSDYFEECRWNYKLY